jgi:hypothetical protein
MSRMDWNALRGRTDEETRALIRQRLLERTEAHERNEQERTADDE